MDAQHIVDRRTFFSGAALGMAAGAAVAGGLARVPAQADEVSPALSATDYQNIYEDGVNLMPGRTTACPGPRGPVAFEDRDIPASDIASTEDCDIVVVGAGIAGLIASLKAADRGRERASALEKIDEGPRLLRVLRRRGCRLPGGAPRSDKAALLDELYRCAYWRARPEPARTYVDRSGEATDFWQADARQGSERLRDRRRWNRGPRPAACRQLTPLIDTELGFYDCPVAAARRRRALGPTRASTCAWRCKRVAKVAYANLELRFSTPGVQLVRDGSGRVGGVIAKRRARGTCKVEAGKGVILATGGYDCEPRADGGVDAPGGLRLERAGGTRAGAPRATAASHGPREQARRWTRCPQPVMNFRWGNPDSFYGRAHVERRVLRPPGERPTASASCARTCRSRSASNAQNAQPAYGRNCWYVFDETMYDGMQDALEEFEAKGWLFEGATPRSWPRGAAWTPRGSRPRSSATTASLPTASTRTSAATWP